MTLFPPQVARFTILQALILRQSCNAYSRVNGPLSKAVIASLDSIPILILQFVRSVSVGLLCLIIISFMRVTLWPVSRLPALHMGGDKPTIFVIKVAAVILGCHPNLLLM